MTEQQGHSSAIMEDRRRLMLTGVTDVESFNEEQVSLYTHLGELTVRGSGLHIPEMSLESGELTVEGDISALSYGDRAVTKRLGLLGRIFR